MARRALAWRVPRLPPGDHLRATRRRLRVTRREARRTPPLPPVATIRACDARLPQRGPNPAGLVHGPTVTMCAGGLCARDALPPWEDDRV